MTESWCRFQRTCLYTSWSLRHLARDVPPIYGTDCIWIQSRSRWRHSLSVLDAARVPEEEINLYKIIYIFFYKCMQTIKLRQTTENNGGCCTSNGAPKRYPSASKNDAKEVPWASKSDANEPWPSINMWRVGSENVFLWHYQNIAVRA